MAHLSVTTTDATRLKTLLTAAKNAKHELAGDEALAFAQAFHWGTAHLEAMVRELKVDADANAAAQRAADLSQAISAKEEAAAKAAAEAAEKVAETLAQAAPPRGKKKAGP